ncbi:transposase [cyanobacterium TDX16]|nr:transposase [cyanobacterium TDX16]
MIISYDYKLNPSNNQSALMSDWLNMLRGLYNFGLRERIEAYEQVKYPMLGNYCRLDNRAECCPLTCSLSKSALHGEPWKLDKDGKGKKRSAFEMQCVTLPQLKIARPWYKQINAQVIQQTLRQLDTAFQNFFKHGRGYPKPKRRSHFRSFSYPPGAGVKIKGNRIYLPGTGWMRFFLSRQIPDGFSIRTVTVRRKSDGWYISVRLEDKNVPLPPTKTSPDVATALGADVGIRKLVALSSGETIQNPRFSKRVEKRRRRLHRAASRQKKGSKNRQKSYQQIGRLEQRVENQRNDYQWKVANRLVRQADCIVFEDLNIRGMTARCKPKVDPETGRYLHNGQAAKAGLNRAILDASWYGLKQKVKAVAAKSGAIVLDVPPRHSSQECRECGYISPTNRDKEKFLCESCGHYEDADIQASRVLLARGLKELGIEQLCGVPAKVTPKPEVTGCKEISPALVGEPGNPRQLTLFDLTEWRGA